jgi:hypothetical protein
MVVQDLGGTLSAIPAEENITFIAADLRGS